MCVCVYVSMCVSICLCVRVCQPQNVVLIAAAFRFLIHVVQDFYRAFSLTYCGIVLLLLLPLLLHLSLFSCFFQLLLLLLLLLLMYLLTILTFPTVVAVRFMAQLIAPLTRPPFDMET